MRSIINCVSFVSLFFIITTLQDSIIDKNELERSIRPGDDFYMFVNSRWINRTKIPPSESEWGGLYTLKYENLHQLQKILHDIIENDKNIRYPIDSIERQLIDFYLSGIDKERIESVGIEPLRKTLVELENIKTHDELIDFVLDCYIKMNQGLIFDFDVFPDERNSTNYIVYWKQTGIQLPERDYYFRHDSISKTIRLHYIHYIDRLLSLSNSVLNRTTNLTDAQHIFSLETHLAKSHRSPNLVRDVELNYNKYNIKQLDQMMPNLKWSHVLSRLNIKNETVIVSQPDYYQLLDKLIVNHPLSIWKIKIRYTLLHEMSKYLCKDFVEARYNMFQRIIDGQKEDKSRSIKVIEVINSYLGEALGQLYVSNYFSSESKERIVNLVENLIKIYYERIERIDWIKNSTKTRALNKLKQLTYKIGYPSKWKSYKHIFINQTSYFQSMSNLLHDEFMKKIEKLKKFVDRDEWLMPPQTVNAFYNPLINEIVFPAGILQEPFYFANADDAINYGTIACIIGHELTHGFDDQGRKYDENGNLNSWWTNEDIDSFNSRANILVNQYNQYKLLDLNINGQLTLGENIADLGALHIAYNAFLRTKQAEENVSIDNFTPKQRFFLAFATLWRVKLTDEKLLSDIKIDYHAPPQLRINGPLSNMNEFYHAFDLNQNDGMFRQIEDRVVIW